MSGPGWTGRQPNWTAIPIGLLGGKPLTSPSDGSTGTVCFRPVLIEGGQLSHGIGDPRHFGPERVASNRQVGRAHRFWERSFTLLRRPVNRLCQGLAAPPSVVVVEGPYDAAIIRGLYRAVDDVPPMPLIVVAMGHLNLPHVALAQLSLLPELRRVIVVADGDGDIAEVSQPVYDEFRGSSLARRAEIIVIVVNPSLEAALGIARRQVSPDQIALEIRYENIRVRAAENDGLRAVA